MAVVELGPMGRLGRMCFREIIGLSRPKTLKVLAAVATGKLPTCRLPYVSIFSPSPDDTTTSPAFSSLRTTSTISCCRDSTSLALT